jgi:hypothetical protein
LEVEVEKFVQMGMAMLEQLSWFRPDPALEGALPQESAAPPPPVMEASGSTTGEGTDAEVQEAVKEAMPEDPSAQVGVATRGGS